MECFHATDDLLYQNPNFCNIACLVDISCGHLSSSLSSRWYKKYKLLAAESSNRLNLLPTIMVQCSGKISKSPDFSVSFLLLICLVEAFEKKVVSEFGATIQDTSQCCLYV